ncbi:tRNA (Guanine37-N(1)-) methyltransferase [Algoriphagus ornithinivorans]|jgi:tRNA (guanine37-N1)-methyltransferase|uniref:tRNA (guanine-N(1)-)-methyltransferase n=1 Tax=Algoriphagus ornithinivorans TaxID=226506 RepID=A0A1I5EXI7_9BACT|nr:MULTISPECIES: tRNA (guanosine(37)-N1)-methyltransferase TrmD [Algoriphagus]MAL12296.1 tRNA (guanosine(37)-N1)-methyltransferase TrmD [Algoriphagus sp.]MAN88581.1 tRNA (guanosine(37)-N1)-methyltransferase TrmD [Algoriphagus sp.]QYH40150.1 tRNA (guanosine(37)-N1)-methyltransferase TrmD [Algoriphagus sp. NBT04N3]SFO15761.1 tRNA (Guanine37-N(1)-) methyltransferase [Algoriphagus ornithinivorans]HAH36954.1 tRNA (guanosine(37)-N1)-methyltransferase TrmD [Algoriphagus sp.]|tara:strand:- start:223 stop:939 length:717 start_codon:yes stop_codon:yes gene_type:complete
MHIDIISVVPGLLEGPFSHSILKRAEEKGLATIRVHNLRDYATGKQKQVDDYAFGGGAGMVMMIEPIANCIEALQKERTYDEIIYMTPDGKTFDQPMANTLSMKQNLLILCGHYKGVDERIRERFITQEISIGDFVLSGGELAAAVVADAVIRLLPGVLNDETSALTDSFQDNLLAPPVYTRPAEWQGMEVPEVLLSGHEAKINEWRFEASVRRTRERRPDLWAKSGLGESDLKSNKK